MIKKLKIYYLSFIIRKPRGFTLIELLVAIAIIGILSSFLLSNFVGVRQRARDGVRKSDLRQIQSALELYRSDLGEYPTTGQFPTTCGSELSSGGTIYMKKIPCDPSTIALYPYEGIGSIGTGSISYKLIACLESSNDSQKDPTDVCGGAGAPVSYTLQNP